VLVILVAKKYAASTYRAHASYVTGHQAVPSDQGVSLWGALKRIRCVKLRACFTQFNRESKNFPKGQFPRIQQPWGTKLLPAYNRPQQPVKFLICKNHPWRQRHRTTKVNPWYLTPNASREFTSARQSDAVLQKAANNLPPVQDREFLFV